MESGRPPAAKPTPSRVCDGTQLAQSFGRAAEEYELGRPGYAEAAFDAVGLAADAVVLDLAAGTGKLTRQLVPRVARVIAVAEAEDKRRPVLVVTRSEAIPVLSWLLVAPVTKAVRGIPTLADC